MPTTKEIQVYKFTELDDSAKEKARQWYREGNQAGYDWWESVYEWAVEAGNMLGIEFEPKRIPLMNGSHREEATIYFSGFCSQGDGACFEGDYSYKKGAKKAIHKQYPKEEDLHVIADRLVDLQRGVNWGASARMRHRGHYYHEMCMSVEVEVEPSYYDKEWPILLEDDLSDIMRDFARWIYRKLENEDEYLNSDEVVDESIECNEYEFDEDGNTI